MIKVPQPKTERIISALGERSKFVRHVAISRIFPDANILGAIALTSMN